MNKTILYAGAFRFPAGDAAAARVLNNAKIMRAIGYKVVIISFGGQPRKEDRNGDGSYCYQGFQYINTDDIDIKQPNLIKRVSGFMYSGRKAFQVVTEMISKAKIVIAYQPSAYFTNQVIKLCKSYNKPFIADLTEWYAPSEFPGGIYLPASWLNEWNMRIIQKKVSNKIVISSYLDDYYKSSHNIILPPLVDNEEEKWRKFDEVLPEFDGIRIIYAGNPGRKDLLEMMLEAVIRCLKSRVKLQFIIVGPTLEEISHYKNIDQVHRFSNNILLRGKVPQTCVPSYYHAADFSLLIRERNKKNMAGFPTKFAESNMAGCPVITNNTSDLYRYLENGVDGFLIEKFSVDEIANILKDITELTPERINCMKDKAKEKAISKFNYKTHINTMNKFLMSLK